MLRLIACNDTSVERVAKARFPVHEPALPVGTKFRPRRVAATRSVADKAPAKQEVISANVATPQPKVVQEPPQRFTPRFTPEAPQRKTGELLFEATPFIYWRAGGDSK